MYKGIITRRPLETRNLFTRRQSTTKTGAYFMEYGVDVFDVFMWSAVQTMPTDIVDLISICSTLIDVGRCPFHSVDPSTPWACLIKGSPVSGRNVIYIFMQYQIQNYLILYFRIYTKSTDVDACTKVYDDHTLIIHKMNHSLNIRKDLIWNRWWPSSTRVYS